MILAGTTSSMVHKAWISAKHSNLTSLSTSPFLSHSSDGPPLCKACWPIARQLSEEHDGFLCQLFHTALLRQTSKRSWRFPLQLLLRQCNFPRHHRPLNFGPSWTQPTSGSGQLPFLFQPYSTMVGTTGRLVLWLLTTWKWNNCQIHPRRKMSKDIYINSRFFGSFSQRG